jgi:hypothetical protein
MNPVREADATVPPAGPAGPSRAGSQIYVSNLEGAIQESSSLGTEVGAISPVLGQLHGLTFDASGNLYVASQGGSLAHTRVAAVAVDRDGNDWFGRPSSSYRAGGLYMIKVEFPLPLERIKEFHVETLPLQLVEIRGVALEPVKPD